MSKQFILFEILMKFLYAQTLRNIIIAIEFCLNSKFFHEGKEGYSLSAVLDDPCKDFPKYSPIKSETLVHLICQKGIGTERTIPEYHIESCTIIVQRETSDIPQLNGILLSHFTQVRKARTEKQVVQIRIR